ncbi:transposase family protein, partial [Helicobacter sp. MIT 21-1697]|uniref:integrase catalytic domain-containing protein n=1 Tax=Helicobacter sp. MIT 21-1697 TaxID=2993733 RepID=UPI00224A4C31
MISYCVLERYVKAYLKSHPIESKIIYRGEDAAVGNFLPALGQSNWAVDSINQIVEIDATSIDAVIDVSEIARNLGLEVADVEKWQKRFVLISLIDTYSGVCSFHISDTENALGVSRAIAKYITTYGKPKCIKSDNGSAFVSKYTKEVLTRLDIKHIKSRAYAGWCKPYVERNFARLQNHLMEWIKGYIGHSVSQRQAIEFFFSRAQRRLKRGQKSNQTNLHTLQELGQMIDTYTHAFMNNAYLERLNATPAEAYNAKVSEAS